MVRLRLVVALAATVCLAMAEPRVRYLHIISEIQARFAITDVLSQVENMGDRAEEVTFMAQIPNAAFISNFSLEVDDTITYGTVKEKEQANQEYEEAKSKGQTAAQVLKMPRESNNFIITLSVARNSKVNFNLTYQEMLMRRHGVYKHIINIQPQQPVDDIQADVLIAERGRIAMIYVPEFGPRVGEKTNKELLEVPEDNNVEVRSTFDNGGSLGYVYFVPNEQRLDGQLVVLYDVERDNSGGEIDVVNGYFVHFFAPDGVQSGDKNIVFVLDKSGSMEQGRKFIQLKNAMKAILKQLRSTDKFNILFFNNAVESWQSTGSVEATSRNVDDANRFIDNAKAAGGTNIHDALKTGYEVLKDGARNGDDTFSSMLILLTDGQPTVGEKNADTIIADVSRMNAGDDFAFHGLAFGHDADFDLLKKVSQANRGIARYIYEDSDAEMQLEGFVAEISNPLLKGMQVRYISENVDVSSLIEPSGTAGTGDESIYYDGSEVVIVGKMADPGHRRRHFPQPVTANVTGAAKDGRKSFLASAPRFQRPLCFPPVRPLKGRQPRPVQHFDTCAPQFEPIRGGLRNRLLPRPSTVGGFIERMWAYLTIQKLLDQNSEGGNAQMDEKRALELSLKYGFVTSLTSMVVVLPNEGTERELLKDVGRPGKETKGLPEVEPEPCRSASGGRSSLWNRFRNRMNGCGGGGNLQERNMKTDGPTDVKPTTPQTKSCNGKTDVFLLVDPRSDFAATRQLIADLVARFGGSARFHVTRVRADGSMVVLHRLDESTASIDAALDRADRDSAGASATDLYRDLIADRANQQAVVVFSSQSGLADVFGRTAATLRRTADTLVVVNVGGRAAVTQRLADIAGDVSRVLVTPSAHQLQDRITC